MQREVISEIAHRDHPVAAPVSDQSLRLLLERLARPRPTTVLDLGCGAGSWLLALLEAYDDVLGTGVDTSAPALDAARAAAARLRLADRVRWVQADAAAWAGEPSDVVLCVGASHAFGGLDGTLAAVRRHLRPGGRVLLGDGIWDAPPSAATLEALEAEPGDFPDLAGLVEQVTAHGFEVGYGHVSTLAEWDEYEWSWTGSLVAWALSDGVAEQDRRDALDAARSHRRQWLEGYRGQLGFVTVVLHDIA